MRFAYSCVFIICLVIRFDVSNISFSFFCFFILIPVEKRLYPSSSFWGTYFERQRQSKEVPLTSSSSEEQQLLMRLDMWIDYSIKCDEIDGVVIGSWRNISKGSDFPMTGGDIATAGYWVCAAIWSDSWDQTTIDRVRFIYSFACLIIGHVK